MTERAVLLAHGLYRTTFAKTSHGLVRGPSRYHIVGVIDPECAGADAGELLDGKHRGIPVFDSLDSLAASGQSEPDVCVVGVANPGGYLPAAVRRELVEAARAGWTLVNGLHQQLGDDDELVRLTRERGGAIIDIRRPPPTSSLHFWTGEVLALAGLRVALLGTDCALGKRTTCTLLRQACRDAGIRTEMVYTGQTGWLQGVEHGFILDATPNDFVCGELERALVECQRERDPEVILIEGQSGLRNPSGPCGSELILAAAAGGVILHHAPGRRHFEGLAGVDCRIPPLEEEIELIRLLGAEVWALALHDENLAEHQLPSIRRELAERHGVPVVDPRRDGVSELVSVVREHLIAGANG